MHTLTGPRSAHDRRLLERRARALRDSPTPSEELLWQTLRGRRFWRISGARACLRTTDGNTAWAMRSRRIVTFVIGGLVIACSSDSGGSGNPGASGSPGVGGGSQDAMKSVGFPCASDAECASPGYCSKGGDTIGLCTMACETSGTCQSRWGDKTACLVGICYQTCDLFDNGGTQTPIGNSGQCGGDNCQFIGFTYGVCLGQGQTR